MHEDMTPALRCVGNLLTTSLNENVDLFLFHGGLKALEHVLDTNHDVLQTVKECLWAFSNIVAGSEDHIRMFLSADTLVEKILELMTNNISNEIRREAILTFTNLIVTT